MSALLLDMSLSVVLLCFSLTDLSLTCYVLCVGSCQTSKLVERCMALAYRK